MSAYFGGRAAFSAMPEVPKRLRSTPSTSATATPCARPHGPPEHALKRRPRVAFLLRTRQPAAQMAAPAAEHLQLQEGTRRMMAPVK